MSVFVFAVVCLLLYLTKDRDHLATGQDKFDTITRLAAAAILTGGGPHVFPYKICDWLKMSLREVSAAIECNIALLKAVDGSTSG